VLCLTTAHNEALFLLPLLLTWTCHTHQTGSYRDVLWPDQWTAVTYDGSRSAQFEHTMLVTETGVELLTARVGAPTDRIVWDRDTFQR
jgi:methionine aminopeptidase